MAARASCLALSCALLLGCERGDGERASASAHDERPPASTSAPELPAPEPRAAPQPERRRCLVPLPSEPPPDAEKAADCPPDPEDPPELPRGRVTFVEAPGSPSVDVEIAATGAHRQRGLMYRTEMADDAGMLFSWSEEAPRSFWMKNTCIPLDMLFVARDGTIVGILEQVPTLSEAPRRIPCPAAHVLEVNAGWVRAHDVKPGQRLQIDS